MTTSKNCIIKFPNGKYGFVGNVDVRLGNLLDGKIIETEEDQRFVFKVLTCRYAPKERVTTRTYDSEVDAITEATRLDLPYQPIPSAFNQAIKIILGDDVIGRA